MEKEIYNAAVNGDLTIFSNKNVEYLLQKTYQNYNIIHVAAQHKQIHFIKVALNSFPTTMTTTTTTNCESLLCEQNCQGNTPLHIAAQVGDEAVVNQLYDFFFTQCGDASSSHGGSDRVFPWRVMNKDGNTPVHVALLCGNFSVAMYLVEKDEYVARVLNRSKEALLHLAIQYHVIEKYEIKIPETRAWACTKTVPTDYLWPLVELLLKIDSSVACWANAYGSTPLHMATSLEPAYCIRVVKAMLSSCPEAVDVHDKKSGNTILHLLTNHHVESYEQGQELLSIPHVNALINSQNRQRDTPLHLAVRNRDTIMVKVLLASSPKLWLKNKKGVSADSLVRQFEEWRITEKRMEKRRKLTEEEYEAAKEGDMTFLNERLCSIGTDFLLSQTPMGGNILHIFLQCKFNLDMITEAKEFIGKAIERLPSPFSQQDHNGDTPVHVIADNGYSFMLLDYYHSYFEKIKEEGGGSRHSLPWRLKNLKGDTPLHVAARTGHYNSAVMLVDLDPKLAGYCNERKQTPLHLLSQRYGYEAQVVGKLINCMTSGNTELPYMQDEDGLTPLLVAAKERSFTMIELLFTQFPASAKVPDFEGRTLWHWFASRRLVRNVSTANDFKDMGEFLLRGDDHYHIRELMETKDKDGNTPLHLAITNQQFGLAQFFLDNWVLGWTVEGKYRKLLYVENNAGVSAYNLIGSAEHLPRELEEALFTNGNLLFGHRSLYGVPTTKIEEYANSIGVIAALLATITFTAAFTVPGGLNGSNGTPLLLRKEAFISDFYGGRRGGNVHVSDGPILSLMDYDDRQQKRVYLTHRCKCIFAPNFISCNNCDVYDGYLCHNSTNYSCHGHLYLCCVHFANYSYAQDISDGNCCALRWDHDRLGSDAWKIRYHQISCSVVLSPKKVLLQSRNWSTTYRISQARLKGGAIGSNEPDLYLYGASNLN